MPKGYWLAQVDVTDPDSVRRAMPWPTRRCSLRFGGRYLVRAGQATRAWKGRARSRLVVIEFPDYAAALACYRSPPTTPRRKAIRLPAGVADIVVVEGYAGRATRPGDSGAQPIIV